MTLLVADLSVISVLSTRGLLPRLLNLGPPVATWDFLVPAILDGRDRAAIDWLTGNRTAIAVIATAFTLEAPRPGRVRATAGFREGKGAKRDYGLLASWAAAALAEDIRVGRRRATDFAALASQALVVQVLRDAGMTVHDADWVGTQHGGN